MAPRISEAKKSLPSRLVLPVQGTADTTHANITSLPLESLAAIYDTLAHPRDQIAFAITCGRFAAAARSAHTSDIKPGTVQQQRNTSAGLVVTVQRYGKEQLAGDLRRWGFIPKQLKLCRSCWSFLPRRRIWKTREGRELKALKHVDWSWAVMRWTNGGKICPTCQIPAGYDDSVKGQFLQRWGEGLVSHALAVQTYEVHEENDEDDG